MVEDDGDENVIFEEDDEEDEGYLFAGQVPQDFDSFRQPNMHHGMEACLGLSMGPICSRFN